MGAADPYRSLPDEDYRYTLGITRGSIDEFFAPTSENVQILRERRHWFDTAPELYAGLLPTGELIADEFCRFTAKWIDSAGEPFSNSATDTPLGRLIAASTLLEPDVVLLRVDEQNRPITVGGCVCFPSSWSLPEKLGLSIAEVHEVVPGMNAVLGERVDRLMLALKAGEGWVRSNWSSKASSERNHHPQQPLPEMSLPLDPGRVWLRREHQILFRLPETGGIVFGIRLEHTSLRQVLNDPEMARRWARGLQTMPAELLSYKRLLEARQELVQLLTGPTPGTICVGDGCV